MYMTMQNNFDFKIKPIAHTTTNLRYQNISINVLKTNENT